MKRNDSSSKAPFDPTASVPDFRAPIAPEVYAPLEFPTVEQLLQHASGEKLHPLVQLTETKPLNEPTVFDGILGGNLDVLVQDAQRDPERYSPQERALLEELASEQKNVKALERSDGQMLTQAVMSFTAVRRPKPKAQPVKPPPPKVQKPVLMMSEDELRDGREPQVEMPGGAMTPYWWAS